MKKWIFRLLVTFVVLGGLCLFGLQIVSGTTDKHKRGLEDAFSQIFHGTTKFGQLKAFNLFPRFSIEIENLEITGISVSGTINAAQAEIGFGPLDLILKNRKIEKFYLKDLNISAGVYTPLSIYLADAGLYKNDTNDAGRFAFSGKYGTQSINGQIDMAMEDGVTPKYLFNEENNILITVGAVQLDAVFMPYNASGPQVKKIMLSGEGKGVKMECELPSDKVIPLTQFMKDVIGKTADIKSTDDLKNLCGNLKSL
jgi:hypothetical protein